MIEQLDFYKNTNFLIKTYKTKRIKVVSVWSEFTTRIIRCAVLVQF